MSTETGTVSAQRQRHWRWRRFKAQLRGEFPLRPLADQAASQPYDQAAIPPVVYQTWETKSFGKTHHRELLRFRALNPQLAFVLYDTTEMNAYMATHWGEHPIHAIFQNCRHPPMAVDIFRYCILFERGGFYFDINKGIDAPIVSFLQAGAEGLVTFEHIDEVITPPLALYDQLDFPDNLVAQWGIGFRAGHPFLGRLIDNICAYYPRFRGRAFPTPKMGIIALTGPGMFTKTLREHVAEHGRGDILQAGMNFGGHAIWKMKGSYVRYFTLPTYADVRDDVIVT